MFHHGYVYLVRPVGVRRNRTCPYANLALAAIPIFLRLRTRHCNTCVPESPRFLCECDTDYAIITTSASTTCRYFRMRNIFHTLLLALQSQLMAAADSLIFTTFDQTCSLQLHSVLNSVHSRLEIEYHILSEMAGTVLVRHVFIRSEQSKLLI